MIKSNALIVSQQCPTKYFLKKCASLQESALGVILKDSKIVEDYLWSRIIKFTSVVIQARYLTNNPAGKELALFEPHDAAILW